MACESKLGGDRTCLMLQAKHVLTQHRYSVPLLSSRVISVIAASFLPFREAASAEMFPSFPWTSVWFHLFFCGRSIYEAFRNVWHKERERSLFCTSNAYLRNHRETISGSVLTYKPYRVKRMCGPSNEETCRTRTPRVSPPHIRTWPFVCMLLLPQRICVGPCPPCSDHCKHWWCRYRRSEGFHKGWWPPERFLQQKKETSGMK